MQINAKQCKVARELLGWSQQKLSEESKVSKAAISFFERQETKPTERTMRDLVNSFENFGIKFIDNDTEFGAVILKKK